MSHELDLIQRYAECVTVLKKGACVDQGPTQAVLGELAKPYVKELLSAMPHGKWVTPPDINTPILQLKALSKVYGEGQFKVSALNEFEETLNPGETLSVVGLSGSGKSTLAKLLVALETPTGGQVLLNGHSIPSKPPTGIQMVFQDPYASLNPNYKAIDAVKEVVAFVDTSAKIAGTTEAIAMKLLTEVGFDLRLSQAYPHQMSGGQRQRLCIARALAAEPQIIICDEPTSALDQLVADDILKLLKRLQDDLGVGYLFITHDLGIVRRLAHRTAVMLGGEISAQGPTDQIF